MHVDPTWAPQVSIRNSIFYNNHTDFVRTEFGQLGSIDNPQPENLPSVTYSLIQGLDAYDLFAAENIGGDPLFVNGVGADAEPGTPDDDLRLTAASPCLDRGDSGIVPEDNADADDDGDQGEPTPDQLLNPRRSFPSERPIGAGCAANTGHVDLGALEYSPDLGSPTGCTPNGISDADDIRETCALGTAECMAIDSNEDHIIDACQDCNQNSIPDPVEILNSPSIDCNQNCVIDSCETDSDCDNDGVPDICEIIFELDTDCDLNQIPDDCDLVAGADDCNENDVLDRCEMTERITYDGTEFIVAFPPLLEEFSQNATRLQLHLLARGAGTAQIVNPTDPQLPVQNVNLSAGAVTIVEINRVLLDTWAAGTVAGNALIVTSTTPMTCVVFNRHHTITEAALALPVESWGAEYIVVGYEGGQAIINSQGLTNQEDKGQFVVVAQQDDTTVSFTPKVPLVNGFAANQTHQIVLDRGESFLGQSVANQGASADITGSVITANKPIGVFSGNRATNIPTTTSAGQSILEMLEPVNLWGTDFLIADLPGRETVGTLYRYVAAQNGTIMQRNGVTIATLQRGQFHEERVKGAAQITSNSPMCVVQYETGTGEVTDNTGDPAMVLVRHLDQFATHHSFSTELGMLDGFGVNEFPEQFVTVFARCDEARLGGVVLDGVPIDPAVFSPIGNTDYCVARIPIAVEGRHDIASHFPHTIIAQGSGESIRVSAYLHHGGGVLGVRVIDDCNENAILDECEFPQNLKATVRLEGVKLGTSVVTRCIRLYPRSGGVCGDPFDVLVDFTGNPATGEISGPYVPPGCEIWDSICVKDEQHTLSDDVGVHIEYSPVLRYIADDVLVLLSGDFDNDNFIGRDDIEIALSQFQATSDPNSAVCPWNGIQFADCTLDGVVDDSDLKLVEANFLKSADCCMQMSPLMADPGVITLGITTGAPAVPLVDLNNDGVFDVLDVQVFESLWQLDDSLSQAMINAEDEQ